jgi:hypothetical protein
MSAQGSIIRYITTMVIVGFAVLDNPKGTSISRQNEDAFASASA